MLLDAVLTSPDAVIRGLRYVRDDMVKGDLGARLSAAAEPGLAADWWDSPISYYSGPNFILVFRTEIDRDRRENIIHHSSCLILGPWNIASEASKA
jgi:hypothetical protein